MQQKKTWKYFSLANFKQKSVIFYLRNKNYGKQTKNTLKTIKILQKHYDVFLIVFGNSEQKNVQNCIKNIKC